MDEYLKTLLEQIRCKKARPYVKQEFQDHIEDQIEANMQAGISNRELNNDIVLPISCCLSIVGILNISCSNASKFRFLLTTLAPCSDISL